MEKRQIVSGKCELPRCKLCVEIKEMNDHVNLSGHDISFNDNMSCISHNIIYAILCSSCGKHYIGETKCRLNLRINFHREQIKRSENAKLYVSRHIHDCGAEFKVIPIFSLPSNCSSYVRKHMENYFIKLTSPSLNSHS